MRRSLVIASPLFAFLFATPATATPVEMSLSDPSDSFIRMGLLVSDGYDSFYYQDETPPTGGSVSAEIIGTLDPGFNVTSMSITWDEIQFTGTIPNVGPFSLVLDPLEISLLGSPLNTSGRVKPGGGWYTWSATSSIGAPEGTLTVAGNTETFAFENLLCPSCANGAMRASDLTGLYSETYVDSNQWNQIQIHTVGDVVFDLTVTTLWKADYTVIPEPTPALLLAFGLAGLVAAGRERRKRG